MDPIFIIAVIGGLWLLTQSKKSATTPPAAGTPPASSTGAAATDPTSAIIAAGQSIWNDVSGSVNGALGVASPTPHITGLVNQSTTDPSQSRAAQPQSFRVGYQSVGTSIPPLTVSPVSAPAPIRPIRQAIPPEIVPYSPAASSFDTIHALMNS